MLEHNTTLAVFYPCTLKEYQNTNLSSAISKILDNKPSDQFSFDLFLIFDQQSDDNYDSLRDLVENEAINELHIHSLDIPPEDNIYVQTWDSDHILPEVVPSHGLSSGPNHSFYQSLYHLIDHSNNYDNFLLLETDMQILKSHWLDFLIDYCKNTNFTIAGSKYKGTQKWHRALDYKDHLNGIALYKNSKDLLYLLKQSEKYLQEQVKQGVNFLNFDIAIDQWRRTEEGQQFFNKNNQLIDTKFITNASDPEDELVPKKTFLDHFPETLILHHKTSALNFSFQSQAVSTNESVLSTIKEKKDILQKYSDLNNKSNIIPLFFHIPKNAGTYVISKTGLLMRAYKYKYDSDPIFREKSKSFGPLFRVATTLEILDEKNRPLAIINGFDVNGYIHQNRGKDIELVRGIYHRIHLKNLSREILESLELFQVNIVDHGFAVFEDILSLFNHESTGFIPHALLRDPFKRALSIYNYLTSEASSHEPTHMSIFAKDFQDYISGIQSEDSWLIRKLLNIPNTESLTDELYDSFCEIFDLFMVTGVENVDGLLASVYEKSHSLFFPDINPAWNTDLKDNKNLNGHIVTESDVESAALENFKKRVKYDYLILEKYAK